MAKKSRRRASVAASTARVSDEVAQSDQDVGVPKKYADTSKDRGELESYQVMTEGASIRGVLCQTGDVVELSVSEAAAQQAGGIGLVKEEVC